MAKWYSHTTQIRWACKALIRGREISHSTEIQESGGWRLSAIIYNLRHRYKWPIITRYDENKIAHYRLGHDVDKETLKKPRSFYKKEKATLPCRPEGSRKKKPKSKANSK